MKTWQKQLVKTVIFLLLLAGIAAGANAVLITKYRKQERADTHLADQSEVIVLGTSQGYNGINPQVLWDEFGIPSYNYSTAAQYIGITYYYLKDILQYQKPKVIVLDIECVTRPEEFLSAANMNYSFTEIKDQKLHNQMYREIIEGEPVYEIPLFRFHNRWREISKKDFRKETYVLGADPKIGFGEDLDSYPPVYGLEAGKGYEIGQREQEYLIQIRELAEQYGIPLVMVDLPSYADEELQAMTAAFEAWAKEQGFRIMMMNSPETAGALSLTKEHFADDMHLNVYGAEVVSRYLGEWLSENFSVGNHQEDPDYSQWNHRMENYRAMVTSRKLKMEDHMEEYFNLLDQGRYTISFTLAGNFSDGSQRLESVFEAFGINPREMRGGEAWVKELGEFVFASANTPAYLWIHQMGKEELVMRKQGEGQGTEMLLWQVNMRKVNDGVNLLVYDHTSGDILECIGFDASNGYGIVR